MQGVPEAAISLQVAEPARPITTSAAAITAENEAVVGHIFSVIARLSRELGFAEKGYRVVSNIGEQGQQTVPHLHFHVLAGRDMTWPPG